MQKNQGLKQCNTYRNTHNPPDANSSRSARLPLLSGESSNKQGVHDNRNKKGNVSVRVSEQHLLSALYIYKYVYENNLQ